jgi:hypothetical protein
MAMARVSRRGEVKTDAILASGEFAETATVYDIRSRSLAGRRFRAISVRLCGQRPNVRSPLVV